MIILLLLIVFLAGWTAHYIFDKKSDVKSDAVSGISKNESDMTVGGLDSFEEMMRQISHTLKNGFHTVIACLDSKDTEKARETVENMNSIFSDRYYEIVSRIQVPSVAALILSKQFKANERGITLNVSGGSRFSSFVKDVPHDDIISIIANVIDSSIEKLRFCSAERKIINVSIWGNDNEFSITVSDSGEYKACKDVNLCGDERILEAYRKVILLGGDFAMGADGRLNCRVNVKISCKAHDTKEMVK